MFEILIKDLGFGYKSQILNSTLNFKVNEGDYVVIVGENGSGKSTLIKTLLGLLSPIKGEIKMNGINRSEIGYLPQNLLNAPDFPATVWEVVLSGSKPSKKIFYSKKEKDEAMRVIKYLGIESLKDTQFSKLSGGQQEKVLLGRSLVGDKKVLILDEPTTGLDPNARENLYKTLSDLNNNGTTIIMISHDTDDSIKCATHVLKLGKDVSYSTKEDFLNGIC